MLSLTEELVLFLLDENSGAIIGPHRAVRLALAGSVLVELSLSHRIDTDLNGLRLLDGTPVGDTLLDPTLESVASEESQHDLAYWIQRTAEVADEIRDTAVARLVAHDILNETGDDGSLSLTPTVARGRRYPSGAGESQEHIHLRIMRVLFNDDVPDPKEAAIVGLADACNLFGGLLDPSEQKEVRPRIDLFCMMDPIGQTVGGLARLIEPTARPNLHTWAKNVPRARGLPLIGNAAQMSGDALAFWTEQYGRLGPVFRASAFTHPYTILAGPAANRFLMRQERFHLNTGTYVEKFRKELGANYFILGMDGPEHRRMRQAMKNGMSRNIISDRLPEAVDIIRTHVALWPLGKAIPGLHACQGIITEQVGALATSTSPIGYLDDIIYYFHKLMLTRVMVPFPIPLRTPKFLRARRRIEEFCRKILLEHQLRRRKRPDDLIDSLLDLHRADPLFLPETDLAMAVLTPFIAALDTAASTTASMLYILLKNPDLQERARAESDRLFADGPPTLKSIQEMDVIHRIAMETLRMYPALPAMIRTVGNGFEFEGIQFPPGEQLIFATTVTHYLRECFPNPYRFDIDRYLPDRAEHRQPTSYVPFGIGAHRCLGAGFAEVQIALTVATILHDTVLELDPQNYEIKMVQSPFAGPNKRFRFKLVSRRH